MPLPPGALVLVVGPSGAGKDTLIRLAREAFADDPSFVFARRLVTRASDPAVEDHETLSVEEYRHLRAEGCFALDWEAHGLSYALCATIDQDIAAGRTVIANVSRRVVAAALKKYASVLVVFVDAQIETRRARLRARGREAGNDIVRRAEREVALPPEARSRTILNDGAAEAAAARLVDLIRDAACGGGTRGAA